MADVTWTIVVPVLNEGATLGRLLDRLYDLPQLARAEVLVVDGGSTDHTRDVFIQSARRHPRLYLLDAPAGKGLGLRLAFARARGRYLAFIDGDLQYAPSDLPRLMGRIERGADLVVSRRRVVWADHSARRLASRTFVHLGRGMLHLPVSDPQSGMKALRASLLPRMRLSAKDWGLDVELIHQAQALGARIEEVEIDFHPRAGGSTKTDLMRTAVDLLSATVRESLKPPLPGAALGSVSPAKPNALHPTSDRPRPAAPRRASRSARAPSVSPSKSVRRKPRSRARRF